MARKKRKVAQVNSSSSADIAFLLLIFFLVTTSMDTDKGLIRRLPPPVPADVEQQDIDIKQRNVLEVLLNSDNKLMVEGEPLELNQLRDKAKEFIDNKENLSDYPEKEIVDVPYFGQQAITKYHVISLQNDRNTEYQAYLEVQNELVAAYNELRNEIANRKFGKNYVDLMEDQQKAIQTIYPQKISEAEPKNYGAK